MKSIIKSPFGLSISISLILFSCIRTFKSDDIIIVSGSNTSEQLTYALIDEFHKNQKSEFHVSASFEGSNAGIWDLIMSKADIVCSSRKMNEEENEIASENGINPVEVIIGYDALSFITNARLGVDSLSLDQLKLILSGQITNWKEVNGPDLKITLYGRNVNSGSRQFIEQKLLGSMDAKPAILRDKYSDIIEAVQKDFGALGYCGVGNLINTDGLPTENVWAINIYSDELQAISPYEISRVKNGEYPLSRPLFQYYRQFPSGKEWEFIQFILSDRGQEVVASQGFFKITENHRALNALQGVIMLY